MTVGGRKSAQASRTAEARRCQHCHRSNALIDWDPTLRYCRWSREDKCEFTAKAAMIEVNELRRSLGYPPRYL